MSFCIQWSRNSHSKACLNDRTVNVNYWHSLHWQSLILTRVKPCQRYIWSSESLTNLDSIPKNASRSSCVWPMVKCSSAMLRKKLRDVMAAAHLPNRPFFISCKVFCCRFCFLSFQQVPLSLRHTFQTFKSNSKDQGPSECYRSKSGAK